MKLEDICLDKYIYLDWNVVKNMIVPRKKEEEIDLAFTKLVLTLKKKYRFPYSEAHIKDRANRYDSQYYNEVKTDFEFFEKINKNLCIGRCDELNRFGMVEKSMMDFFNEYVEEKHVAFNYPYNMNPEASFNIDMNQLDETHPLYNFFKERNGRYSAINMSDFLQDLYKYIFIDVEKYRTFRTYISKLNIDVTGAVNQQTSLKDKNYLNYLLVHMLPLIDSMQDSTHILKSKWKEIAESWFTMYHKKEELTKDLLLIHGYCLLDIHPRFQDKLKKGKNTLDNILRDANHAYYASEANYFVTSDRHTIEKTSFIYDAYDIKTKVVSEEEFINRFC